MCINRGKERYKQKEVTNENTLYVSTNSTKIMDTTDVSTKGPYPALFFSSFFFHPTIKTLVTSLIIYVLKRMSKRE